MIKGSELIGRTVVDMEAATRVGKIKDLILQGNGERVAGLIVSHGETIVGSGGTRRIIPASALHAIGPDAITAHSVKEEIAAGEFDELPRMCDVVGHKMVTRSGRLIGLIDDLFINGADGKIIGFSVGESVRSKLENVFHPDRPKIRGYVRADADLQVGNDLIVVPDDALIEGELETRESEAKPVAAGTEDTESTGWAAAATTEGTPQRSIWTRRTDPTKTPGPTETSPETTAELAGTDVAPTRRIVPIESRSAGTEEPAARPPT